MTESNETKSTEEQKTKASYKDIIKQQLEAKKNKQNAGNLISGGVQQTKKMKSQQARKASNSHRKMGV
ncbi:hypothetical protein [Sporosarcina limicola]|uniref:Uncharacterized protein n=1 Tax=Sporosarcina limicola TaxID=34101 RepID=A0A927R7L3_9BACL|nr:hypothetical protein [Sporosarcina limicola]MBE1556109.1 hypothetical protein [Sporosarcina limicola]